MWSFSITQRVVPMKTRIYRCAALHRWAGPLGRCKGQKDRLSTRNGKKSE